MNDNGTSDHGFRGLWKWASTPPQAYVVYVLTLILVWAISFLAGTLNPKRVRSQNPPPVSTLQR